MAAPPNLLAWTLLRLPVAQEVCDPYVLSLIRTVVEVLEDRPSINDAEAYIAFRRTIGMLAVLADEGRPR